MVGLFGSPLACLGCWQSALVVMCVHSFGDCLPCHRQLFGWSYTLEDDWSHMLLPRQLRVVENRTQVALLSWHWKSLLSIFRRSLVIPNSFQVQAIGINLCHVDTVRV